MHAVSRLLQLSDSAFPSGAFSHSFGLETAIREGRVRDGADLERWLRAYLAGMLTPADGAAIALVMRGIPVRDVEEVLLAIATCFEAREASARIGRAALAAYASMGLDSARLAAYRAEIAGAACSGHAALAFALAAEAAAVPPGVAIEAYLSSALANIASAAVRAVPIGQRACQRVLWNVRDALGAASKSALRVDDLEALGSWAFDSEIDAQRHRLLDGRIFAS